MDYYRATPAHTAAVETCKATPGPKWRPILKAEPKCQNKEEKASYKVRSTRYEIYIPQISLARAQELLSCYLEGSWKSLLGPSCCCSRQTVTIPTPLRLTLHNQLTIMKHYRQYSSTNLSIERKPSRRAA